MGWKLGTVQASWSESLSEKKANLEKGEWEMERDGFLETEISHLDLAMPEGRTITGFDN